MFLWTALRAFFATLFNRALAEQVRAVLDGKPFDGELLGVEGAGTASTTAKRPAGTATSTTPPRPAAGASSPPPRPAASARSDALTLLAALQREGRLLDFLMEDLGSYADAQVGAVARDLHRDCRGVVQRMFGLAPLATEPEGSRIELTAPYDAARYRVLGSAPESGRITGTILHPGWQATRSELPVWSGSPSGQNILAPTEVEVR
ncbi:MAG: DUF2760 domain-containing protein [Pirellulales bacterium]|nr:DUF2760 domain-containing protein [Pirellulales bacterium]